MDRKRRGASLHRTRAEASPKGRDISEFMMCYIDIFTTSFECALALVCLIILLIYGRAPR
jgi:hypothetical protein